MSPFANKKRLFADTAEPGLVGQREAGERWLHPLLLGQPQLHAVQAGALMGQGGGNRLRRRGLAVVAMQV